jgi:hypothetical protein
MLSFLQYMAHKDNLNHLKHKLKSPLSDEERQSVHDEIENITKMMMHHLSVMQPGISEDAGAVASAGPTNVVSSGAIAGSGGKGGEPGVDMKKKRKVIIQPIARRTSPKL